MSLVINSQYYTGGFQLKQSKTDKLLRRNDSLIYHFPTLRGSYICDYFSIEDTDLALGNLHSF